jgi:hypothetical protein
MADIKHGWAIVCNDGQVFGSVHGVGQNYVVASRGVFAAHLYIPASAIAVVEREVVRLNLAKHDAEQMGWEEKPREPDSLEDTDDTLHRHF